MPKSLYIVYDLIARSVLGSVIQESSDAPAIRAFYDAMRSKGSLLEQHPADFNLLLVGTILSDGAIIPQPRRPHRRSHRRQLGR